MKIAFATLGCKVNQYETMCMIDRCKGNFSIVSFKQKADVYIINGCCVTSRAAYETRLLTKKAFEVNKQAKVIVCGCPCYMQTERERLEKIGVHFVLGHSYKHEIVKFILKALNNERNILINEHSKSYVDESILHRFGTRARAFSKIQEGCNFHCSFCILPYVRGKQRSKGVENVLEEVKSFVKSGHGEVVLTGTNIGSYHFGLKKLVQDIEELNGDFRIRISSIEPVYINDSLIDVLKQSKRAVKHLHIPLQSGSNKILKLMNRPYEKKDYYDIVWKLSKLGFVLGTDLIVGFPTETDVDFEETATFIKSLPLQYAHIFTYSKREKTPAASIKGEINGKIAKKRGEIIRKIINLKNYEFRKSLMGKRVEVITEPKAIVMDKKFYRKAVSKEYISVLVPSSIPPYEKLWVKISYVDENFTFAEYEKKAQAI